MVGYDDLSERTRAINEFIYTVNSLGALLEDLDMDPRVQHFTIGQATQIGRLLRLESENARDYMSELIAEEYEALEARAASDAA